MKILRWAVMLALVMQPLLTSTPAWAGGTGCPGGSEPLVVPNNAVGRPFSYGGVTFLDVLINQRTVSWWTRAPYRVTAVYAGTTDVSQWRVRGVQRANGWEAYTSPKFFTWVSFCVKPDPYPGPKFRPKPATHAGAARSSGGVSGLQEVTLVVVLALVSLIVCLRPRDWAGA